MSTTLKIQNLLDLIAPNLNIQNGNVKIENKNYYFAGIMEAKGARELAELIPANKKEEAKNIVLFLAKKTYTTKAPVDYSDKAYCFVADTVLSPIFANNFLKSL